MPTDGAQDHETTARRQVAPVDARISALRATALLDSPPEEAFDRITDLVARALSVPVSLVTLVDEDRQFFKASRGLPAPYDVRRETPLTHSFCRHVVDAGAPLVVGDVAADERVSSNPGREAFDIAAYLGVPLTAPDGTVVGAVCAIDHVRRVWTDSDVAVLEAISGAASTEMRLRAEIARRSRVEDEVREHKARLEDALTAAGIIGTWTVDVRRRTVSADRHYARLFGLPGAAPIMDMPLTNGMDTVHPDDRQLVKDVIERAMAVPGPFELRHRILRADGTEGWVDSRGASFAGPDGRPERVTGVVADISPMVAEEERRESINHELSHRVKNLFATVQAVVGQSLREAKTIEEARAGVIARIQTLTAAHDMLVTSGWVGADVRDVATRALAPFGLSRFDMSGPEMHLDTKVALAFSLAFHELATNAVKHGSLTVSDGRVNLEWTRTGEGFEFAWRETGGPRVATPTGKGFGTRLLTRILATEIRGTVELDYAPAGAVCVAKGRLGS